MRNILAHIPPKAKEKFAAKLKQIWLQNSKKEAYFIAQAVIIDEYGKKFSKAIEVF